MRALIDTCVIIDAIHAREPFVESAGAVLDAAADKRFEGFVTAKEMTDIYHLLHRATHSDVEARTVLNMLLKLLAVVDTKAIDIQWALASPMADHEDAVMSVTASREGMDCIVTRNVKDYQGSRVPVLSPDDFLRALDDGGDSRESTGGNGGK